MSGGRETRPAGAVPPAELLNCRVARSTRGSLSLSRLVVWRPKLTKRGRSMGLTSPSRLCDGPDD